ncbi:MAG: DUF4956 domain-containing protein [Phycisphaerales bacterium]|nr:MAG: DUF4956 domain-containing protein [Phycisphaerales bacterium]
MNRLWQLMEETPMWKAGSAPGNVLLSLLLAFVLGQVLAWVYRLTHNRPPRARSLAQSLVLITVAVALVMAVVTNNVFIAVGLMGAFAIIRFRHALENTRDIAFLLWALVVGMAAGSHRYATAVVGTALLSLIAFYLSISKFGNHRPHDGFLRFSLRGPLGPDHPALELLRRFCKNFTLCSAQNTDLGDWVEYVYRLVVRNAARNKEFLSELKRVEGVEDIRLIIG